LAVKSTGRSSERDACGRSSIWIWFVLLLVMVYYPFVCTFILLGPESTAGDALASIGVYLLVILGFLTGTLYMAWIDDSLRSVEIPTSHVARWLHRLHMVRAQSDSSLHDRLFCFDPF
jgi:hypothetical protein